MKDERDYIRDIAEMRSMMERSSKFLSLSGRSGMMAGIYALSGAFIAYKVFDFNPDKIVYSPPELEALSSTLLKVIFLGLLILALAIGTAIFLSYRKANKRRENLWNATARRLLVNIGVPLVVGGLLILIMISHGLIGLIAPFSLIFYGMALYNAGRFTYEEIRTLGLIQIALGLFSSYFVNYGVLCWALGFGVFHIVYGIYIHNKYER